MQTVSIQALVEKTGRTEAEVRASLERMIAVGGVRKNLDGTYNMTPPGRAALQRARARKA